MKDPNEQFNHQIEEKNKKLSHQLVGAYNEQLYQLDSKFLCLRCNGISIDPLFCRECGYSYCKLCLVLLPEPKIKCLCKKSTKTNFEPQINNELLKTYYLMHDKSDPKILTQISYLEALSYSSDSPYAFISTENYDPSIEQNQIYYKTCLKLNNPLTSHKQGFVHQFSLTNARLLNFHFAKGYPLLLKRKVLCKNDAIFLRIIHLRATNFINCLWDTDFSLPFCKSIQLNIERIEIVNLVNNPKYGTTKSFFIILNAFKLSSKIKMIGIHPNFNSWEDNLILRSFYNFLSSSYYLEEIEFSNLFFYDYMDFQPFTALFSLQTLTMSSCKLHINIFEYYILNNIPKLNTLLLNPENRIKPNPKSESINEENSKLKKFIKFPPIIIILSLNDYYNCLNDIIFQELIQCDTIKMKSLFLLVSDYYKISIANFIKFLQCTKLQFLSLFLNKVEGFDSEEFCAYLRNSEFLIGLSLTTYDCTLRFGLILQALSVSKSIKLLKLNDKNLSIFFSDLTNLILTNRNITDLCLCKIEINLSFIEALSKNKSLLYLDLSNNKISEDDASKLLVLNLKGINLELTHLSKETTNQIYQQIPKKNSPIIYLTKKIFI